MTGGMLTIQALSIQEPWGSRILSGEKTIETRRWETAHRGPLLLCASKFPRSEISGLGFALALLVDCRVMVPADEVAACCPWYAGAFSFCLERITPIRPIPIRGQLGLFMVDLYGEAADQVRALG